MKKKRSKDYEEEFWKIVEEEQDEGHTVTEAYDKANIELDK